MALERGIALAAFAIGLVVVVLALVGCGEGDDRTQPVTACFEANSSLPVVGARLAPDGASVQFAYAGAEPCMFAADLYPGERDDTRRLRRATDRLYVELRTNTELSEVDRRPPLPTGCAIGELRDPVKPGTPVESLYGNRRLVAEKEIRLLLKQDSGCVEVPQGQPAFIID